MPSASETCSSTPSTTTARSTPVTVTEPTSQEAGQLKSGRVVAIAGPVVDVEFPTGALPDINTALEMTITVGGEDIKVAAETAQQLGSSRVRAICMKPTDGLIRGTEVRNLGHPLQMPVGDGVLGHVLNVLGEPLDVESLDMSKIDGYRPIHRQAPDFADL